MFRELVLADRCLSYNSLDEILSYRNQVDSISVPTGLVNFIEPTLPIAKCGLIDFPGGLSATNTRVRDIKYLYNFDYNGADIVLSPVAYFNENYQNLQDDIAKCVYACKIQNMKCRFIIEPNFFMYHKIFIETLNILQYSDCDGIILGTGSLAVDNIDYLIITEITKKRTSLPVFVTDCCFKNDVLNLKNAQVDGFRFTNINKLMYTKGV